LLERDVRPIQEDTVVWIYCQPGLSQYQQWDTLVRLYRAQLSAVDQRESDRCLGLTCSQEEKGRKCQPSKELHAFNYIVRENFIACRKGGDIPGWRL
jgi:hypothetical protein